MKRDFSDSDVLTVSQVCDGGSSGSHGGGAHGGGGNGV